MNKKIINFIKKFLIFTNERFDPLAYSLLIVFFVLAHFFISGNDYHGPFFISSVKKFFWSTILSILFFLKLRCFDELKDYETDKIINPNRPLPRGLLSLIEVKKIILALIIFEFSIVLLFSPISFFILLFSVLYSLLMYKEFFIPEILKPHLTTYALIHTIVTLPFSLTLLSFFGQVSYSEIPFEQKIFSLLSWPLFNIFEFGRKSFCTEEERPQVPTYSSLFGRFGAVLLNLSQVSFALFCLYQIPVLIRTFFINYISYVTFLFLLTAIIYIVINKKNTAIIYRFYTSLFILLVYAGIILNHFR